MTATAAPHTPAEVDALLKTLANSTSQLTRNTVAQFVRELLAMAEKSATHIIAAETERDAALAKVIEYKDRTRQAEIAHDNSSKAFTELRELRTEMTIASGPTTPPTPVDPPVSLSVAYDAMVERTRCAAIAMQTAPNWLTDRQYDDMDKPQYGEAIRVNVSRRILDQPKPIVEAKG
jgi:hypothetical protein